METFNKYGVGVQGDGIRIMMPPRGPMSKEDAIILAAWLVTLAGDFNGEKLMAALDAVQK